MVWLSKNRLPGKSFETDPIGQLAVNDFRVLQAVALRDRLFWSWWLGRIPQSRLLSALLRDLNRKWRTATASQSVTHEEMARIALQWADDRIPHLQTLIEATPFECGDADPMQIREALRTAAAQLCKGRVDLDMSVDALSVHFHALVKTLYNSADAQYVAVRLYSDSIQSGDVPTFIAETQAAFAFKHSGVLLERQVADTHGVIVRIAQPISKRRDRKSGQSHWEGSLNYLEAKKR